MKTLDFIRDDSQKTIVEFSPKAPRGLRGKRLAALPSKYEGAVRFDSKIDMKAGMAVSVDDAGYRESRLPTVRDLIRKDMMREWTVVDEYVVYNLGRRPELLRKDSSFDFRKASEYMLSTGTPVSVYMLKKRYSRWLRSDDAKSGKGWNLKVTKYAGVLRKGVKKTVVENVSDPF